MKKNEKKINAKNKKDIKKNIPKVNVAKNINTKSKKNELSYL